MAKSRYCLIVFAIYAICTLDISSGWAQETCTRYSDTFCESEVETTTTAHPCDCGTGFGSFKWGGSISCYIDPNVASVTCTYFPNLDCSGSPIISEASLICGCYPLSGQSVFVLASCIPSTAVLPVELTSFDVSVVDETVHLAWETASETDNSGFEVERRSDDGQFATIGFVEGNGTTSEPARYSFVDERAGVGLHAYRLKQLDYDGSFDYSEIVEALVEVPGAYVLEPAYPNPFNPTSIVRFAVSREQAVEVRLIDASGRLLQTLFTGTVPGNELRSVTIDGSSLSSGSYVVSLVGETFSTSETIVLSK